MPIGSGQLQLFPPRIPARRSVLVEIAPSGSYVAGDGVSARPLLAPVATPRTALPGRLAILSRGTF
jgi:hypothetical protein